ncbi:acyl carrier protein [Marinactinospora rubrisoli]|uniref:Acyl carrier protein n=1 Tax=Marinactinospora rubrisoli TaxID=2715399 RepID=A0ABW2KGW0_9ACTN
MTVEQDDLVRQVAAEMGAVLGRPALAADEDFFDNGGDSYRAIEIITRLVARFGPQDEAAADAMQAELLMAIFDDSTPAAVAPLLRGERR